MLSLISKFRLDRLRETLFGSSSDAAEKVIHGKPALVEVQEAIALVESLTCDAIACQSTAGPNGTAKKALTTRNAFGKKILTSNVETVSGSIATGIGMALTGLRTSVFVSGDQLTDGLTQLQSLSRRPIPLLVHALLRGDSSVGSTHAAYHAASDFGLFQVMPHNTQQAIDFTLLARWISERSLVPGLIGLDRRTLQKVSLPSAELVREFLGFPDESLASPTASQLLLFGSERQTIPGWFDVDKPVSLASLQGANDGASSAIGRQAMFFDHLTDLAVQGMDRLSKLTGRDLSFLSKNEVEGSEIVIVAQGTAYQTALAAASYLRAEKGWKIGVLGLTWLRPFPTEEVTKALAKVSKLLVLECSPAAPAQGAPLTREIRDCVPASRNQIMTAHFGMHGQPLHVGQLVQALSELRNKGSRSKVLLGITTGKGKLGEFPKREGLLRAVSSDYPGAREAIVDASAPLVSPDASAKTIQWIGPATFEASDVLTRLGEKIESAANPHIRGGAWSPEAGVLAARAQATAAPLPGTETGAVVDVLLLSRVGLDLIYNPLADLGEGGKVVIDSDRTPQ
ncbi:MAG: hypothetical protein JSU96_20270, partial [Acidobacteriota bacterium]